MRVCHVRCYNTSHLEATASGFAFRTDDYSVQITHASPARFWLRIELPIGGALVVTDFSPSDVSVAQSAIALAGAFEHADCMDTSKIIFRDIAPADPTQIDARFAQIHAPPWVVPRVVV